VSLCADESASLENGSLHEGDSSRSSVELGEKTMWSSAMKFVGPGLLVCLADTDAGCLIVAAQSGARWQYSLLVLQLLLIPVLYAAQELTVRLGIHTRKGLTACIRSYIGPKVAWASAFLLLVECVAALLSEMSGIASVAELWGVSRNVAAVTSGLVVIFTVCCCTYRQIEFIGVSLGLCELVFVGTMFYYKPSPAEVVNGMFTFHDNSDYMMLVVANIGAVIMPWMVYFQQSAIVARRLRTTADLNEERTHTLIGSFLTQLVMIGMLVTMAAARAVSGNLEHVRDIVKALEPALGPWYAKFIITVAFTGGSLCAAFVVSLAASWAVCEALGRDEQYSLDESPAQAPTFYISFFAVIGLGMAILIGGVNVVKLNVFVEFMDGLLLPFTVGFLFVLASSDILPPEARLVGMRRAIVGVMFFLCSALALVSGLMTINF